MWLEQTRRWSMNWLELPGDIRRREQDFAWNYKISGLGMIERLGITGFKACEHGNSVDSQDSIVEGSTRLTVAWNS